MVFSSIIFLIWFFPVTLVCYFLTPVKFRNYLLLVSSLFFYAWGAPLFVYLLVGSVVADFYIIKEMHYSKSKKKRKIWLSVSIILSLGIFFYFKYCNFFIENINFLIELTGFEKIRWTRIALPVGISFFTFQKITYGIDIYRGKTQPAKNAAYYLLYVIMFPQLIAGPIVRYNTIASQLNNRVHSTDNFTKGFYRFGIGLAKKVLLANTFAVYASKVFDSPLTGFSTTEMWIALLCYTFQIYYDFSGYSDMAIGMGRMFGFHFPENFDSPYLSKNITEFWRRWHITLGHWMRDYLYIPLGGNRVKTKHRLYFNLITVFVLSGLWHGASWNFVIWGCIHGLFLILDRVFLIKILSKTGRFIPIILTFFIVMMSWVFFRIENLDQALNFIHALFSGNNLKVDLFEFPPGLLVFLLIGTVFSIITAARFGKKMEILFYRGSDKVISNYIILIIIAILYILSISSIAGGSFNPFIYFRF